jgi:hypothetical protein
VEAIDFYVCMHKNYGYIKPNATVGKSGYRWKTVDIFGKTSLSGFALLGKLYINEVPHYVISSTFHLLHVFRLKYFPGNFLFKHLQSALFRFSHWDEESS